MYKKFILIVTALCLSLALFAQAEVIIGTDTVSNSTIGTPTPYGTYYKAFRQQYLVLASELVAAGGAGGNIYSLSFNVSALNGITPMNNFRIRLKATNQTSLGRTFETGIYTQAYQADSFIPTVGWNTHTFNAPYSWDGTSNLLVDVVTDVIPGSYAQNASVYYSNTAFNSSLRFQSDTVSGTNATTGNNSTARSNMKLNMSSAAVQDMAALSLTGSASPTMGTAANYTLRVKNLSSNSVSGFSLKLMASPNQELASLPGTTMAAQEERDFVFNWTPVAAGNMQLFGRVVYTGDQNPANNDSPSLDIVVQGTGETNITIGDGSQNARMPLDFYYRNSLYQTLYYPNEIGIFGTITSIKLYNSFSSTINNKPVKIWLGTTTSANLSAGYIPATQLTQVFDANLSFPAGQNTINIPLSTSFTYTGGNLVLMMQRPMDDGYFASGDNFKTQTQGTNRARNAYSDNETYNPNTPPAGSATGIYPKISFTIIPLSVDPVFLISADSHNFGDVNIGGSSSQSFNIMNAGGGELVINSISIAGSTTFALQNLPALPAALSTGQTTSFTATYSPSFQGVNTATITITDNLGGRSTHTIQLSGNGVNDITIGDGSQTALMPMNFYYKSSLYETIYSATELNNFIGMITGIKLYNQFSSNLMDKPVKIWLGRTTQTELSAGWIPASQMTLVYDGTKDFPSGQNIINITFPEPYLFLEGGNLVMMVQRPLDSNYFSSSDLFRTSTGAANRGRNVYSDTVEYDPYSPSGGNSTGIYPKITFVVIPGGVGHISGQVRDVLGQPLSGTAVHLNNNSTPQITAADGSFHFANLLPGAYHLAFYRHGYIDQQQTVQVAEDETLQINITLQSMPQVAVSGRLIASDSLQGIAGVNISLLGYENYSLQSAADGSFLFPQVYADHSYQYKFSHPGYSNIAGILALQNEDFSFGTLQMNELAFAPYNLQAVISSDFRSVDLHWQSPNPNAIGIQESFENTQFPPANWSRVITNNGAMLSNGAYPYWQRLGAISSGSTLVSPSNGSFQAGLWWDYNFQNEWLITEDFTCPSDAILSFDTRVYLGSENGDSYMVKLSSDQGESWQNLWNASALNGGLNDYDTPISLDISEYSGRRIRIAFHALSGAANDGLWHDWFIDNLKVLSSFVRSSRSLEDYDVLRFSAANLHNPAAWVQINTEPVVGNSFTDAGWESLPQGDYYWAVKARYTNSVSSSAAISNMLSKSGGIPAAPQNLRLEILGEDVLLSWDEVTTDTSGSPLVVTGYEIYVLTTPDEEPNIGNLMDITTQASYYFPEVTPYVDRLFFVVKAKGSE